MMTDAHRRPRQGGAEHVRGARAGLLAAILAALVLSGCQVSDLSTAAHLEPVPAHLERKIDRLDMDPRSPILIRIFKEESTLEVWKQARSGRYRLLEDYEICAWSGELGPKFEEGDRQAPEGFYTVTRARMNPNSSYHLAFNIGFPNRFDRSHGRTGSHLMVHGDCSSAGCYAMEDGPIEEIYALAREAFRGGQRAFQVQAFPFRMTPENMARHRDNEHFEFWEMLKEGSDHFEVTGRPPEIDVCGRRYVFNASPDSGEFVATAACPAYTVRPDIARQVAAKREKDLAERAEEIMRLERSEERKERWEEREEAIAAFFNTTRSEEPDTVAGDAAASAAAGETPAVVAGIPVPRPAPRTAGDAQADDGGGFGFFNPFRRGREADEQPVASTAGVRDEGARDSVAASSAPDSARPAPEAREDAPSAPADAETAGEDEAGGFFSSVARGTGGLMRRAGNLFN